jgi:hypothetical protein
VTTRHEAQCPLCGAKLTPTEVLDACEEIADAGLGVLAGRCPYCQGQIDVQPGEGRVDIGYVRYGRFDCVLSLPCAGLAVLRDTATGALRLRTPECEWAFEE